MKTGGIIMESDIETYKVDSDEGKLMLAGKDIYSYDTKRLSKSDIEERYNTKIIDEFNNPKLGFSGYALQDLSG